MKKQILLFWLISVLGFSQENLLFDKANTLYNNGDYEGAISVYDKILEGNVHSSALYFNMANCYYKLNKIAPSIYYYEKALMLSPKDKDVLNNLGFAEQMTIDKFDVIPEIGLTRVLNKMARSISVDGWAVLCVLLMCLVVLFFVAYYLSHSARNKRIFFMLLLISVVVLISSFVLLNKKEDLDHKRFAIVFTQEVSVKLEPNLKSETAFILHEGTKVQIIEFYKERWAKIKLKDGNVGWMSNNAFKAL